MLAEALGVSVNTVRRRLSRLYDERLIRVIGQLDWSQSGEGNPWHVWIRAERARAGEVASGLAELPEVQMVASTAGRFDVYCTVQPASRADTKELLTERLPNMPGIRSAHSELVLRAFTKSSAWRLHRLSSEALEALATRDEPAAGDDEALGELERGTVELLHADGRISAAEVARALDVAPSTAYRLTHSLLQRGIVRPSVEVEPRLLGYELEALITVRVTPSATNAVAERLARHPSARYVTVVAGTSSVIHGGVYADEDALAEFLTGDLAALDGVESYEVSVNLDVHKRHWLRRSSGHIEATQPKKGKSHD